MTALPGLAAVIALIFTALSIHATNVQLQVTEQAQITDRYNAAITNLGSTIVDVRLGGIYALQRIMQDSPRDQPTVVAVLCAYVRDHSTPTARSVGPAATPHKSTASRPPTDIQAALTVVGTRNPANDGSTTIIDFTNADLHGANLHGANLNGAHLRGVDLARAYMPGANLSSADLLGVNFTGANLHDADFTDTTLVGVNFTGANLTGAKGLPRDAP